MVQTEGNSAQFTPIEIYDISESGEIYVSTADFTKGTTFIKPESAETYTLRETKPLKGVYNINQGYAVFKEVDILCESDEYYIVREGDTYGLNNYDHIVQNGDSMKAVSYTHLSGMQIVLSDCWKQKGSKIILF